MSSTNHPATHAQPAPTVGPPSGAVPDQPPFPGPGGLMNAGVDLVAHLLHIFILMENFRPHVEEDPCNAAVVTGWKGIHCQYFDRVS